MNSEMKEDLAKMIDPWLRYKCKMSHVTGLQVAIVHDGEQMFSFCYGMANSAEEEKIQQNTRFRIASVTKPFTAAAVLQLVGDGKIDLDTPVASYLDWFPDYEPMGSITPRQLLSHTAGLERESDIDWDREPFPTKAYLKTYIREEEPVVLEPGETMKYSNLGYCALGLLIEAVSGGDYATYITEKLIKPIGLQQTSPSIQHMDKGRLATGYTRQRPFKDRHPVEPHPLNGIGPAGGICSTAGDVSMFMDALVRNDLMNSELTDEMLEPQAPVDENTSWTLGLRRMMIDEKPYLTHAGGIHGFSSCIGILPEDRISITVLSNCGDSFTYDVTHLLAHICSAFHERYDDYAREEDADYSMYTGRYGCSWGEKDVRVMNGSLVMFSSDSRRPIDTLQVLTPASNGFVIDERSAVKHYHGESAEFLMEGNQATALRVGPYRLDRVGD